MAMRAPLAFGGPGTQPSRPSDGNENAPARLDRPLRGEIRPTPTLFADRTLAVVVLLRSTSLKHGLGGNRSRSFQEACPNRAGWTASGEKPARFGGFGVRDIVLDRRVELGLDSVVPLEPVLPEAWCRLFCFLT
jgi:hypothetical protein